MKELIFLWCCFITATLLQAQVIYVPADYPSIQEAIDAANCGDTILVAEGTYYEQISFKGKKPLFLASAYLLDGDKTHIDNTIIDGSRLPYKDNASVVMFTMGEDTTSVICGFTIQNGRGTLYQSGNTSCQAGGGIFISASGAKIVHNHITQNHLNEDLFVNTSDNSTGAAIGTRSLADLNWVVIANNKIDMNTCSSEKISARGAGIYVCCNSRIACNYIMDNRCNSYETGSAIAGGLACFASQEWANVVTALIINNTIANNTAQASNSQAAGGGASLENVTGLFLDNKIIDNKVITWSDLGGGGGLNCRFPKDGLLISGNIFAGNSSNMNGGGIMTTTNASVMPAARIIIENCYFLSNYALNGGAIVIENTPSRLQNNVFSANNATDRGGALFMVKNIELQVHHMAVIASSSFHENKASTGGAAWSDKSFPLAFNSIFSGDCATLNGKEICIASASDIVEVAYCSIDMDQVKGSVKDGGGNISENPAFADPLMLTLIPESPCINTGTASFYCECNTLHEGPAYDIDGNPRPCGEAFDIGAHELLQSQGTGEQPGGNTVLCSVYPNPANSWVTFEYVLDISGNVQLNIYDLSGKLINTPLNSDQPAGRHLIRFNTEGLPGGTYFYRISTHGNRQTGTGKLLINK